jgi:phosphatidylserine/phosphatidylglycerophosphate/cardiolipin synthase-like enzyme
VHHNFVQRWNEASDRIEADGVWPNHDAQSELPFPTQSSPKSGSSLVQIQRTVRRGHYTDVTPTPGGKSHNIADGDPSIYHQYLKAIKAAKTTIYFEDQAIGAPDIVEALHEALQRGVDVAFLVPADPNNEMAEARKNPKSKPFYDRLGALGGYDNFNLVGIASQSKPGEYRNIYVHAKICLIDDHWATIGSTNIGNRSFFGDTELNATIWDDDVVRALRVELLLEHLDVDTSDLDDRAALALYRDIAVANAKRRQNGLALEGLAFALDPMTYGS